MAYCRSCGMSMSETATVCPACGAAVATTPSTAAGNGPTLVATFNATSGWPGKTITYEAGRFTLDGHGQITWQDVLGYDAKDQLAWAHDGLRDWVIGFGESPPPPSAAAAGAWPTAVASGATRRTAGSTATPRWFGIAAVLLVALTWAFFGRHGTHHYYSGPGPFILIAGAFILLGIIRYLSKRA